MSISNNCIYSSSRAYSIPERPGDLRRLGQLCGSGFAIECADIIERHNGLVVLIASDMRSTLRLREEICQFTTQRINTLSGWETLPYENLSPHQQTISARLFSLYHLPTIARGAMILSVNTIMQRVCPHEFLHSYTFILKKGQCMSCDNLHGRLEQSGYRNVAQVMAHGEFSIRGVLIDLYPMGSLEPYRIDLSGDEINSLRTFDVDSQLTMSEVNTIYLLPVHEFPTNKSAIELFRIQWRKQFDVHRDPESVYQQVSRGIWPGGIEYWHPLFFRQPLPSLFSYLPPKTLIINIGNLESAAMRIWKSINHRYEIRRTDPMRPVIKPDALWLQVDTLFNKLKDWPRIILETKVLPDQEGHTNLGYLALPNLVIQSQKTRPLDNLNCFITNFSGTVIFSVESQGRLDTLYNLLSRIKISALLIQHLNEAHASGCYVMIGACERGFLDRIRSRALICESDLLGTQVIRRHPDKRSAVNASVLIRNFSELHPEQLVVHLDHGIGRYTGLTTLEIGGVKAEYMTLSYAGEDKLYVPISSLHLISRYSGGMEENTPLHKLGGDAWPRAKQRAVERLRDVAAELLDVYAQRASKSGFSFKYNRKQYQMFCRTFPFETTPDQQKAINEVLADMCEPLTMDRLVCGDVGFGKTEVAMRAAFLAVGNDKQVAVLVPTTLLAQQHFDSFRDRFATWAIRIEMMSRFRSAKEQSQIFDDVATGKIDIIIGTHKLLQNNLHWKDLGLLIVDEEHRFGMRHKERIKAMCPDVDILTLTATPIPRTLNMAMNGIRDLSIITTPPARRLAVKTFVLEYNTLVVREAILREVMRGGQVYYLHNNVEGIEKTAQKLAELVPEARIIIGHGQMRERDLEQVINDFHHQRFNVLVCSTIIETGIDIANANTIIIERADRFGLAQLHQLRGRVGRSHHQAYAYLMTPNRQVMKADAQNRVAAIASLEDLGSGFALATHDLEIRGAGELLGADQSGQIAAIGSSLYMELLESTVKALKNGREPSLKELISSHPEIELRIPSLIPEDFIPDVNVRLSFYKRIASTKSSEDLEEIRVELIDRFGMPPAPVLNLIKITALRQYAQILGVKRIDSNACGGLIEFGDNNSVDLNYVITLLRNSSKSYRLEGKRKLRFMLDLSDRTVRLEFIENLLNSFLAERLISSV